jgi:hypothetical protein
MSGPEMFAGLDPLDPEDAARISENQGFLRAASAGLEDLTTVTGFRVESDGTFSFVNAYQIAGADPAVMQEVVLAQFVESYAQEMALPMTETRDIEGRTMVILWDEAVTAVTGERQPVHFYAIGDTVWVADVDDPLLDQAFAEMPSEEP